MTERVDLEALEKLNNGRAGLLWGEGKQLIGELKALRECVEAYEKLPEIQEEALEKAKVYVKLLEERLAAYEELERACIDLYGADGALTIEMYNRIGQALARVRAGKAGA